MIPQPQQIPSNWNSNHDWTAEAEIARKALEQNKKDIERGRTKGYGDKGYKEDDYKEPNYG